MLLCKWIKPANYLFCQPWDSTPITDAEARPAESRTPPTYHGAVSRNSGSPPCAVQLASHPTSSPPAAPWRSIQFTSQRHDRSTTNRHASRTMSRNPRSPPS